MDRSQLDKAEPLYVEALADNSKVSALLKYPRGGSPMCATMSVPQCVCALRECVWVYACLVVCCMCVSTLSYIHSRVAHRDALVACRRCLLSVCASPTKYCLTSCVMPDTAARSDSVTQAVGLSDSDIPQ